MNLTDFEAALGVDNVVRSNSDSPNPADATFPTNVFVPAVLRPGCVAEVQLCMQLAARNNFKIHPISTGKNWGYGSAAPFDDGCLLLDLGRMNRILQYDDRLGYVVVEPGVTQQQLSDFLKQNGGRFWMDATGSSPSCSIIGNTLERGFGHTPFSDHFANSCAYQVVLPSGELIETGLAAMTESDTRNVFRWGVGPFVDGLFSQSRFGIVTRMTIWLMSAPESFLPFFFTCRHDEALPGLIGALREARQSGILQSSVHIVNDYRVLCGIQQYPWEETEGNTPLSLELIGTFRKREGFGAWNGSGALYGPASLVRTMKKLLGHLLRPKVDSLHFASKNLIKFANYNKSILSHLSGINLDKTLNLISPSIELLRGNPTSSPLASIYWRKRSAVPDKPNPDRDKCGLLWSAPVCPADGPSAVKVSQIVTEVLISGGFEPFLSFTLISSRALIGVISIVYDRDVQGEDSKAIATNTQLNERLTAAGFPPYRLGVQSMQFWNHHHRLKALSPLEVALDPQSLFSPGHYSFS